MDQKKLKTKVVPILKAAAVPTVILFILQVFVFLGIILLIFMPQINYLNLVEPLDKLCSANLHLVRFEFSHFYFCEYNCSECFNGVWETDLGWIGLLCTPLVSLFGGYWAVKKHSFDAKDTWLFGVVPGLMCGVEVGIVFGYFLTVSSFGLFWPALFILPIIGAPIGIVVGSALSLLGAFIAQGTKEYEVLATAEKITKLIIIVLAAIIIAVMVLPYMYYSFIPKPVECTFSSPEFTCKAWKLHNDALLDLEIQQFTNKTIRVNGFGCSQDPEFSKYSILMEYTEYLNATYAHPFVMINNGESAYIAKSDDQARRWLLRECGDASGLPYRGVYYDGKVYLNYTEEGSNVSKLVVGELKTIPGT